MEGYEVLFAFVTNVLFVTVLGYYLITNLQWYDYKLSRVVLKHHKPHWHVIYFIIPFMLYHTTGVFFSIFFYHPLNHFLHHSRCSANRFQSLLFPSQIPLCLNNRRNTAFFRNRKRCFIQSRNPMKSAFTESSF